MPHRSLLDNESKRPDDDPVPSRIEAATMNQLITAVEIIKSNYATKEDLADLKEDQAVIRSNYATKEDLASVKEDLAVIKNNYTAKEDLASIKEDLAVIKNNYTTKEELASVKEDLAVIKNNYTTKEELASVKEDLAVIKSNYVTKEELAILSGKVDVLASNQEALQANLLAFQTYAVQNFATKAELSDAVYQLTWRMAGFAVASISATAAFVRYL